MNQLWKKRLHMGGWVLLTLAGLVLMIAAVTKKNANICTGVKVELSGSSSNFFIDEKEVTRLLNANGKLQGKNKNDINLLVLENRIENDSWILNAELFFDSDEVLNVLVEEREPVARVFTKSGSSFYLDTACKRLPTSDKVTVRVPMFSGFPTEARKLKPVDSTLLVAIKDLAVFIRKDAFWNAQVAQVDITPNRTFEMIPTIGSHVVVLGRPEDYEEKFSRLYTFYQEVWTKVGLEKYSKIDVQFNGQVVATRKGEGSSMVDSVKAKAAYERLMQDNRNMQQEEPARNTRSGVVPGKQASRNSDIAAGVNNNKEEREPASRERDLSSKTPKAVMPKQEH
ncbi:hypothetical protein EXU57_18135 [Segetibacter sp. 3557_3]|uniref:cell division protein FtsQ/DivIB n=1 Tax=Segetibacter sp. 3557_3 TaxID=2547429 RepID=UPI001058CA8E|nr:hypothetical protein [Segetibacter sp. 3557_3]TDH22985.1 hypothetical protein EXU57_18135 [Segetibacter sp. 3557_3]